MADPDHDHDTGSGGDPDHPSASPPHAGGEGPAARGPAVLLSLNDLLDSVYAAVVAKARDHGEKALDHMLSRYFPMDPQTGRMAPRTVQVALPGPNGTPILHDLPLIALTNQQDVALDSFVMKMKAGLSTQRGAGGASNLLLDLAGADPGGQGATAEIEVRFRGAGVAQGIARINETIVRQIGREER